MRRIAAVFFVSMLFMSISALDVSYYGTTGLGTWLTDKVDFTKDKVLVGTDSVVITKDSVPQVFTTFSLDGKLGLKLAGDRFGACVEFGASKGVYDIGDLHVTGMSLPKREGLYVSLRKWYGELYLNDYFTLLVGQTYTPANFLESSNQAFMGSNSFLNVGSLCTGRSPMLQFTFENGKSESPLKVELKAAVVKVDTTSLYLDGEAEPIINVRVPKFEGSGGIRYSNDVVSFRAKAAGGVVLNTEYISQKAQIYTKNYVNSGVFGLDLSAKVKMITLTVNGNIGKNYGLYGIYYNTHFVTKISKKVFLKELLKIFYPYGEDFDKTGGKILDSHAGAFDVILRGDVFNWLGVESGYGFLRAWHDYKAPLESFTFYETWHNVNAFYVNVMVKIYNTFSIVPEYGMYDYGPKQKHGRLTYAGLQTVFDF